jgi:hypothetical protein
MFRSVGYEMRNWIDAWIRFWYVRRVSLETTVYKRGEGAVSFVSELKRGSR